ncbi:hypothetical protein CHF27_002280 [Romboutsia maritimum]|uniref:Potassium channel domain-containing protein n=1 Tax=Romboutsia maritimum TaxID=2020948 RepID=A0A371IVG8_9FIRM|nr:pentapeptide repeat-containing protein [Romboutsia maritimum]RDY24487.1 hypothetical protein CHF27_002280 [Romboutsia maritimum]
MQFDNFDKIKKNINEELDKRIAERNKNYYIKMKSYKKADLKKYDKNLYIIENDISINFMSIKNKDIRDKSKINKNLKIIENSKIEYNEFMMCKFENIIFENCTFYGTIFSNCILENVTFNKCKFFDSTYAIAIFKEKTIFKNCYFKECLMENTIFLDSKIDNTKFVLTNLRNSILKKVYINEINIMDCDLRAFKIVNSEIEKLEFEDDFLSKLDENTFIDKIRIENNNYEKVSKVYRNIAYKFENNRLLNMAGEYYFLSKCTEHKSLKGFNKVKSYIFWILCGYGERPTYALITSIEIVLIFTIMYMFSGLDINGHTINYKMIILNELPVNNLIIDFMRAFYFSIVTFTTVGYGDIIPKGFSVFLSGVEMFLGVTMVGVWTATLSRKITR